MDDYLGKEYHTYIKSPRWKALCQRAFGRYGKFCAACGSRDKLHVHHMTYERFGRESLADLKVLCDPCHKAVHRLHRMDRSVPLRLVTERYVAGRRRK